MRKIIPLMALIMCASVASSLTGAEAGRPDRSGDEEVKSAINKLMDQTMRTAETLDAERTLAMLTDDNPVFFFDSKPSGMGFCFEFGAVWRRVISNTGRDNGSTTEQIE